jgi:hypothetical protein
MSEPAKDEAELIAQITDTLSSNSLGFTHRGQAVRAIATIRAAGWAVVPGWQPIETALTDETAIILWPYVQSGIFSGNAPQEVVVGFYSENYGWYNPEERKVFEPTHWMPLPAAPEGKP